MQLLGLILLIASSWYIWKLSTNFFDDETKEGFSNDFKLLKNKINETTNNFSMDKLETLWKKYKEEEKGDKSLTKKE